MSRTWTQKGKPIAQDLEDNSLLLVILLLVIQCGVVFPPPLGLIWMQLASTLSGRPFFPLICVHCLETDIIPQCVHQFDVSPDGVIPRNVWLTSVSFWQEPNEVFVLLFCSLSHVARDQSNAIVFSQEQLHSNTTSPVSPLQFHFLQCLCGW